MEKKKKKIETRDRERGIVWDKLGVKDIEVNVNQGWMRIRKLRAKREKRTGMDNENGRNTECTSGR